MQKKDSGLTFRSLLLGILLIPINCYWVTLCIVHNSLPSGIALFPNVVFIVFVLVILNLILKRVSTRLQLSQGELLNTYVMLSIATAIAGNGFAQSLPLMMGHGFWAATPENEWAELFHRDLPTWLTVSDKNVLRGYYEGDTKFFVAENIRAWGVPVLWWSAFVFAVVLIMLCINIIVRKQWTENEKLAYPITQIPTTMTNQDKPSSFLKSRLLWIGFGIAAIIDIVNGLNFIYPSVISIPVKMTNIGHLFSEKPLNAIGWLPISFYPAFIGIAFFMPLSLSFSAWFFFLFNKFQLVAGSVVGLDSLPGFLGTGSQSSGAFLALAVIALWGTKSHLRNIVLSLFPKSKSGEKLRSYNEREPMSYRATIVALALAILFIIFFCLRAGMSFWMILIFFAIYYAIATAVTRMRAELGSPVHDLALMSPDRIMTDFIGTRYMRNADLSMFSLFWFFNRSRYSDPMPHQLEGFKMAERTGMDNRKLLYSMIIAMIIVIPSVFAAVLHLMYKYGATTRVIGFHSGAAWETFERLQRLLNYPAVPDWNAIGFTLFGFLFTIFLMVMRGRFIWWPFHPVGYVMSGGWSMATIWTTVLVSWFIKWVIIKYGGIRLHRKAIPFFVGLVVGEFVMGSIWSIIGIVFEVQTYKIWP